MTAQSWQISVGSDRTTAEWIPAADGRGPVFICAHGAGGHMGDRSTLAATAALQQRGIGCVRFNFIYREKRSSRPDPMPRLIECFWAVIARVKRELDPAVLVIGGRSMGGRAASMLLSQQVAAAQGLLLLAYPLHPPGQPEKIRDAHLAAIQVPVLCFNGTRDPFCDPPLMNVVVSRLGSNWRMVWIEGADHSFHVLKRSGRTDQEVLTDVAETAFAWAGQLA